MNVIMIMKNLKILVPILCVLLLAGCKVSIDFDGAMIERFTNKISYLYANCRSDMEWLQETMTPEMIESMDQTCVASIKAITKIKWKIQNIKNKVWDSDILNQMLEKIDEIITSLQNSKDQIKNYSSNVNISGILNQMSWSNLIESLENLTQEFNN